MNNTPSTRQTAADGAESPEPPRTDWFSIFMLLGCFGPPSLMAAFLLFMRFLEVTA